MKLQRISDRAIFEGIEVPEDRTKPVVPCCLIGQIEAVDDESGTLWVFTDDGRVPAYGRDIIVHDGARVIAVLSARGPEVKGWKPVKEPDAG